MKKVLLMGVVLTAVLTGCGIKEGEPKITSITIDEQINGEDFGGEHLSKEEALELVSR